jgi:hypothetical protein
LLLAALPAPAEFTGEKPSEAEINGLLEMLIQLPPNLHATIGTAVRMVGGSMGGESAVDARVGDGPAPSAGGQRVANGSAGAYDGAAGQAQAYEASNCAAAAPAVPTGMDVEIKPEPAAQRRGPPRAKTDDSVGAATSTKPRAVAAAAPPKNAAAALPSGAAPTDSDSDSEDKDAPLVRHKRAGGSDLYLQRLQKKQNVLR